MAIFLLTGVKWPHSALCFFSAVINNSISCQRITCLSDRRWVTWRHENKAEQKRRSQVCSARREMSVVCTDTSLLWWNWGKMATSEHWELKPQYQSNHTGISLIPMPILISISWMFRLIGPPLLWTWQAPKLSHEQIFHCFTVISENCSHIWLVIHVHINDKHSSWNSNFICTTTDLAAHKLL